MYSLLKWSLFRGHVSFQGCISLDSWFVYLLEIGWVDPQASGFDHASNGWKRGFGSRICSNDASFPGTPSEAIGRMDLHKDASIPWLPHSVVPPTSWRCGSGLVADRIAGRSSDRTLNSKGSWKEHHHFESLQPHQQNHPRDTSKAFPFIQDRCPHYLMSGNRATKIRSI